MPNGDVALGLAGLQEWSEPIIFDRLLDIYRGCLGVGVSAWSLARLHAGVWRAAIKGDTSKFEAARAALTSALSDHPVGGDDIAAIDAEILTELLDIVMARFQRSSGAARAHHLALIALAGRLTPPAPAAAA
jgi:hypothetical protein